jgi:hypothetical protein
VSTPLRAQVMITLSCVAVMERASSCGRMLKGDGVFVVPGLQAR